MPESKATTALFVTIPSDDGVPVAVVEAHDPLPNECVQAGELGFVQIVTHDGGKFGTVLELTLAQTLARLPDFVKDVDPGHGDSLTFHLSETLAVPLRKDDALKIGYAARRLLKGLKKPKAGQRTPEKTTVDPLFH